MADAQWSDWIAAATIGGVIALVLTAFVICAVLWIADKRRKPGYPDILPYDSGRQWEESDEGA